MIGSPLSFASVLLAGLTASQANFDWQWVWVTPDYVRSNDSRTWATEPGTANVSFHGQQFSAHLENEKGDPAYNLVGSIHGHKVTAMAIPTDSDSSPRHCNGAFVSNRDAKRISLMCEDGEFIGLIRNADK